MSYCQSELGEKAQILEAFLRLKGISLGSDAVGEVAFLMWVDAVKDLTTAVTEAILRFNRESSDFPTPERLLRFVGASVSATDRAMHA